MGRIGAVVVCLVLAVFCAGYGSFVWAARSGTKFYLVWMAIAAGLTLAGIFTGIRIWEKVPRAAAGAMAFVGVFAAVLFVVIEIRIAGQMQVTGKQGLDYVIVLGAQVYEDGPSVVLKYRLDRAVEYMEKNPDTVCIVSGGQGYNEPFPEAEGMKCYLVGQGIDAEKIVLENKSKTTKENLINSMEYIEDSATVGIITNDFHMHRAMQIAEKIGMEDVCGVAADSDPRYLPNNMLREFFAEIKRLCFS